MLKEQLLFCLIMTIIARRLSTYTVKDNGKFFRISTLMDFWLCGLDSQKHSKKVELPNNKSIKSVISRNFTSS